MPKAQNRHPTKSSSVLQVQSLTKIKWDKVNFDCVIRYFREIHLFGNKSVKNKILISVIIQGY
jgi:ABC-type branched-subunit amino acid transport system ATPase component